MIVAKKKNAEETKEEIIKEDTVEVDSKNPTQTRAREDSLQSNEIEW